MPSAYHRAQAQSRLVKDYERLPKSGEAMIHIAMIRLMLTRKRRAQEQRKQRHQLAKLYRLIML